MQRAVSEGPRSTCAVKTGPASSLEVGDREKFQNQAAWVVPCAHGTPTIRLWSFDVRSEGPSQATLDWAGTGGIRTEGEADLA